MRNNDVIQTGRSADLVTLELVVGDESVPDTVHIQSVVVHREVNRIPFAKITLLDGDVPNRDFPLSNEETFLPGNEIEVLAGYHSDNARLFKGLIVNHRLRIRDGSQQLLIECRDPAYKMTQGRNSAYYYEQSDSELMEALIVKYGLQAAVESIDYLHPELIQYQCSDWDFLVTRAQANGMVVRVEDGTVFVAKPDLSQEILETATFGANILEFDAEMDGRNQFSSVESYAWNTTDQSMVKITGTDPALGLQGNISASQLAEKMGTGPLELKNGGRISESSLQEWADANWLIRQLAKVRGRVKFQGISQVVPGKIIALSGVGDRFSGNAYVSGVLHQLAGGNWTVDVQFGLDPQWFSEKVPLHGPAASGLVAAVKGLQVGKVSQLQDDPEAEERIMVTLPIINDAEQGIWCRVASLEAGEERGFVFRPEIGDEVIVGFINEDPNQAVVLGSLHSSKNTSPIPGSDDNHQKGYLSRTGIKLLVDDELGALTLETPAGKKLHLDDDADEISVSDEHGNSLVVNSDGMVFESSGNLTLKAARDLILEGSNVNIAAQAEFSAEGSAGSTLSSSAVTTVKGSLIRIN
ncbi:type VI secretion system tip protein VgrG [Cyclobacterium xiamenense]|uniref:type VI secretion system tip protein VgrG n=1 Tax=Cyclobacterium xiamenense TaxID=1297121 RepID=UPI0012B6FF94|nr:type VI secretion system tip protein VgrG [Cyclobacterium xiamenense]